MGSKRDRFWTIRIFFKKIVSVSHKTKKQTPIRFGHGYAHLKIAAVHGASSVMAKHIEGNLLVQLTAVDEDLNFFEKCNKFPLPIPHVGIC
ncbi:hypothetical protein BME24068_00367 [Burkholderia metallica]|nr:hypothetical protein BME24068_00367 [Burkholderia metallica]